MESPKIKILLEKYWAGNSTIEEEVQLKQLYKAGIPKAHKKYDVLFNYAEHVAKNQQNFDLSFLDNEIESAKKPIGLNKRKWFWPVSIAASILIMILSVSYQWDDIQTVTAQTEVTTPKTENVNSAYQETIAALAYLSEKLNKGNASIFELSAFDQTQKQVIHENK